MTATLSVDGTDELIKRNGWALAWVALAFGLALIVSQIESGRQRFSAAAWKYALAVPGSPSSWGVVILIGGVLLAYACIKGRNQVDGHPAGLRDLRIMRAGWLAGYWFFCGLDGVAILAFATDLFDDNPMNLVNPTAVIAWMYFAWMYGSRNRLCERKIRRLRAS